MRKPRQPRPEREFSSRQKHFMLLVEAAKKHNWPITKTSLMDAMGWKEADWDVYVLPHVKEAVDLDRYLKTTYLEVASERNGKNATEFGGKAWTTKLAFIGQVQAQMNGIWVATGNDAHKAPTIVSQIARLALDGDKQTLLWLGEQAIGKPSSEIKVTLDNAQTLECVGSVLGANLEQKQALGLMVEIRRMLEVVSGKTEEKE